MLRQETENGWILITHQDHARLAGAFSDHWGNAGFDRPEPFASVREAVRRHDDSWAERDANPEVTSAGQPSAFTRELVGTYDAFEEIDLESYLKVRGRATELVAEEDAYAAILVSMHTVNLLTEQADPTGLTGEEQALLSAFVEGQRRRQRELVDSLLRLGAPEEWLLTRTLRRGFEFLQACDSLSLITCVHYPERLALRHRHGGHATEPVRIYCEARSQGVYVLDPWPFHGPGPLHFSVPAKEVAGRVFSDTPSFRKAYAAGVAVVVEIELRQTS